MMGISQVSELAMLRQSPGLISERTSRRQLWIGLKLHKTCPESLFSTFDNISSDPRSNLENRFLENFLSPSEPTGRIPDRTRETQGSPGLLARS